MQRTYFDSIWFPIHCLFLDLKSNVLVMKVVCSLSGVYIYIYWNAFQSIYLVMRCPCLSCFDEHMTIFIFLLMINCKHIKESIMKVSVAIVKLKMLFKIFSFT